MSGKGRVASVVDFMIWPFAACTSGPFWVCWTCLHNVIKLGFM